ARPARPGGPRDIGVCCAPHVLRPVVGPGSGPVGGFWLQAPLSAAAHARRHVRHGSWDDSSELTGIGNLLPDGDVGTGLTAHGWRRLLLQVAPVVFADVARGED